MHYFNVCRLVLLLLFCGSVSTSGFSGFCWGFLVSESESPNSRTPVPESIFESRTVIFESELAEVSKDMVALWRDATFSRRSAVEGLFSLHPPDERCSTWA
ncbi:hypothetical protein ZHAS_00015974 [Anopheles sinensis]|uniref:Secreted protein n=1 Tax=Anopheles sinensis TaxID=74873 RepID=A0A084WCH1_ANOSI|nr:hypothetical protein ZHAS_00015974 [Anopheles sinensis]